MTQLFMDMKTKIENNHNVANFNNSFKRNQFISHYDDPDRVIVS